MEVIHIVLPLALLLAGGGIYLFAWAVKGGQLDDLETPPLRMLVDDEDRGAP